MTNLLPSDTNTRSFISTSEAETYNWGLEFAGNNLNVNGWLGISGELGAGKTVLARAIIQHFCDHATIVASPSYNLMLEYETLKKYQPRSNKSVTKLYRKIFHVDFFRLPERTAATDLAIEELCANHLVLIEWPEKGEVSVPGLGNIIIDYQNAIPGSRKISWKLQQPQ